MNGDILTSLNYAAMVDFHRQHKPVATVGIFTKKVEIDLGVVETDDNDQITNYIEKPILN
jgi:NDP-sugar pyrophosphorylase family protein